MNARTEAGVTVNRSKAGKLQVMKGQKEPQERRFLGLVGNLSSDLLSIRPYGV